MRFARTAVVTAAFIAASGVAYGQPFKWWQDSKTKAELGLAADQVTRIEEIFQGAGPTLKERYSELTKLEGQLSKLVASEEATEADVVRQVTAVEAVRGSLSKERTLMLYRMLRVLSAEQRTKLNEMHRRWERDRSRGPRKH
jgi:Spy/CpxP family protein refolding chaperone